MDKIAIVQKHLAGFKELKPNNKAKPRLPKEPANATPANVKKYKEKLETYNSKMEKWVANDARNKSFRQIEISADGILVCGSPFRMVRIKSVPNEMEETYYLEGDGKDFPNFRGVIDRLPSIRDSFNLKLDKDLTNFITTISKGADVGEFTFGPRGILYRPVIGRGENYELVEARLETPLTLADPFRVAFSSVYFIQMVNLAKKLGIKNLEISFANPITPLLFEAQDFEYIIAPIRTK